MRERFRDLKRRNCAVIVEAIASSCNAFKAENDSKAQLVVMQFCPYSEDRNLQENKTKHIEVRAIGKPDIRALTESERTAFFETLLARLKELKQQNGN